MIKTIALNIAENLGEVLDSKENIEVYAYSLQMLFILAINLLIVFAGALLFKIVPTTLAFLAVFIFFRAFGGGVHLGTIPRCITTGTLLMLSSAYFASHVHMSIYQLDLLFLIAILFTLLCTVKWVPAGTEKNPITSVAIIPMQKRNMLIAAFIWAVCVGTLINSDHHKLALAMVLGVIVSDVLISPLGFGLMGFIDKMLNNFERGLSTHDA